MPRVLPFAALSGLLIAAIVAALPARALQPTGNAVADAYLSTLDAAGFSTVTFERLGAEGDVVLLENVRGTRQDDGAPLSIARVTLAGGSVDAANTLSATGIRYDNVALGADGTLVSVDLAVFENARFAAGETASLVPLYRAIAVDGLTFRGGDDTVFTLKALRFASEAGAGAERAIALRVEDFTIDSMTFAPVTRARLRALGYDTLVVSLSGAGAWNADTGLVAVEDGAFSIANAGALRLDGVGVGLTAQNIAAVRAPGLTLAERLAVLSGIGLVGLSITFDDAGITERLLDTAAAAQATSREAVIAGLVEQLPQTATGAEAGSGIADLAAQFLAAPDTISLSATPAEPVPLSQLIATALAAPNDFPSLLGLTVSITE